MSAGAPWSVKGIDPKAREVAKELARRAGMTLGEWLNRVILEDDPVDELEPPFPAATPYRGVFATPRYAMSSSLPQVAATPTAAGQGLAAHGRVDDVGRVTQALERLTDRIEASETRTGLAISGVEHSVRHAMARIEAAEREHMAVAARYDTAAERFDAEQARVADRLRRMEAETSGPRSAEALKVLEQSVTRVASDLYEGERATRAALDEFESRLARGGGDPDVLIEAVADRLGQRLAQAEARTTGALESLRGTLGKLDQRLASVEDGSRGDIEQRLAALADQLTQRVEDAREEILARVATSGAGQVEARLGAMADQIGGVEQRSAHAIEAMGREVLAMAETLSRRVQSAEQRSAEAIEQVGGEIARIAGAVESRLGRVDQLHAEALERLGTEIGRITERLTDRIIQSERRAAQAIDDVGEQVARVTERIEQRHERASGDLAERIRQSEERTMRLLETARATVDARGPPEARDEDAAPQVDRPEATAVFGPELFSRAEPVSQPALDPGNPSFGEEDFAAADGFAPISETSEEDLVEPPEGARPESAQLSTRDVIERARAAARASAGAARPETVSADEPRARAAGGRLFGARKPSRPQSTWQTALMVAGGRGLPERRRGRRRPAGRSRRTARRPGRRPPRLHPARRPGARPAADRPGLAPAGRGVGRRHCSAGRRARRRRRHRPGLCHHPARRRPRRARRARQTEGHRRGRPRARPALPRPALREGSGRGRGEPQGSPGLDPARRRRGRSLGHA